MTEKVAAVYCLHCSGIPCLGIYISRLDSEETFASSWRLFEYGNLVSRKR